MIRKPSTCVMQKSILANSTGKWPHCLLFAILNNGTINGVLYQFPQNIEKILPCAMLSNNCLKTYKEENVQQLCNSKDSEYGDQNFPYLSFTLV